MLRDVGLAEALARDALVAALEQWPRKGIPDNPAAWLMAAAKHRAIDQLRKRALQASKQEELGRELDARHARALRAPRADQLAARLSSVLEVIYLVFNEGYSATAGEDWMRPALCEEALRLGRILAELMPGEPEVHGLVALMEIQASRTAARVDATGEPVLLLDQNRARWDQLLIGRGFAALARAEALGGALGPYALQAAIAACHCPKRADATPDYFFAAPPEATNPLNSLSFTFKRRSLTSPMRTSSFCPADSASSCGSANS